MATTIDKYILETSVTGMKDVDTLNTSVTTLGKSIDAVTSKKIAMTINATGFDDLNTKIGNINTSLSTLATKTAKPTVSLAGIDQLNAMISGLSSSINQLSSNAININANTGQVTAAKQEVDRLGNAIDGVDRKDINVKAEVGGGILDQNIGNLKNALDDLSGNLIAGLAGIGTALTALALQSSTAIVNAANAFNILPDQMLEFQRRIKQAGGEAETASELIETLQDAIIDASKGTKDAQDAFDALTKTITYSNGVTETFGVKIADANGELKDNQIILSDVVTMLKLMASTAKTPTEKTAALAAAVGVFGDEAKKIDWAKVIPPASGVKGLTTTQEEFNKNAKAVAEFDKSLGKLGDSISDEFTNSIAGVARDLKPTVDLFAETSANATKFESALWGISDTVDKILTGGNATKLRGWLSSLFTGDGPTYTEQLEQRKQDAIKAARDIKGSIAVAQAEANTGNTLGLPRPGTGTQGPKPKDDAAASQAKADADAKKRARESMDAEMTALKAASTMKLEAIKHEGTLLGLSSKAASENRAAIEIQNNLKRDYLQIDAQILQEKQKGAKADQYIIDKLKEQKTIVNLLASDLLDQTNANNAIKQGIEDRTTALKAQYDEVLKISNIDDSDTKSAAIQKEIDKHKALKDQYTAQYDALVKIGEEQGLLSAAYLTAAETFSTYNTTWMQAMDAQKLKIDELRRAEKDRAESFAGGWDDAMQKMVDSFTPAQQGAKAFNDLWGNIETSIGSSISTGRFEFAKFRDAVIADIAAMMFKAAASNLIGRILGTVVSAAVAPSSSIPGDRGGSALPRAGGGSVSGGQPYMVGERGPELFMPGQNGTIIPNRNLEADSKPQVITNNYYNVSAVDGQSVARFFMENKNMVAAANRQATKERS